MESRRVFGTILLCVIGLATEVLAQSNTKFNKTTPVSTDAIEVDYRYCGVEALARIVAGRTGKSLQDTYDQIKAAMPKKIKDNCPKVGLTEKDIVDIAKKLIPPVVPGPVVVVPWPPEEDEFAVDTPPLPPIGKAIQDALRAGDDVIMFIEQGTNLGHWVAISTYSGTVDMATIVVVQDTIQGDKGGAGTKLSIDIDAHGQEWVTYEDDPKNPIKGGMKITKFIRVKAPAEKKLDDKKKDD